MACGPPYSGTWSKVTGLMSATPPEQDPQQPEQSVKTDGGAAPPEPPRPKLAAPDGHHLSRFWTETVRTLIGMGLIVAVAGYLAIRSNAAKTDRSEGLPPILTVATDALEDGLRSLLPLDELKSAEADRIVSLATK